MNFDTENSQNNLILDSDNNSLSSNLDLDYGLDPIADELSGELQLNSIAGEMPLELETLPFVENDPHQLVFIGSDVIDHQTLVDNISGATDVVLLDSDSDELMQISEHLSNYQDLDAVHIVSHGESGQLSFSNAQLNQDTLPEYVHLVENWGNSLSAEADLLFYGCDVASGEQGNAFIQQISQITDADVAASVDDTGIDGNWKLEAQVGEIEATSAFSDRINHAYQHNLDNFGFAPTTLPDFDVVDFNATNFDFTNVSADNLTIFADAGLDFGGVDASTLNNIDFNAIPAEDLKILDDAGLILEPLSSEEIADINLNVLSGLDYLPEDIQLTEFNSFDESTKFAQFSDIVATNAELFDYKDSDLGFDENITIEQLSEFNADDFRALDYAQSNPNLLEIFDSEFYLEEYPNVKEAGANPFANYYDFGQNGGRYPNEVFKVFGESDEILVASLELSPSQFAEAKELAGTVAYADEGLSEPILWILGGALVILVELGIKGIEASQDVLQLLEQAAFNGYVSELPIEDNLGDSNNTGGIPDEVMIGTEPFDLGELTPIDPENIPKGNDLIEDILNGQFEFPDAEEGGSYLFLASGAFSDGIDETTRGLIGLSNIDDVIESAERPSRKSSETTRGVQAIQKRLDAGNPAYEGFSKTEEDVEKIIRETLGASNTNPIVSTGTNRNKKPRIDIFNPDTGRGVRFVDGKFDTFVNLN